VRRVCPTVGLFLERQSRPDWIWHQCDGPRGRHGDLQFVADDPAADHVLSIGTPIPARGKPRLPPWSRLAGWVAGDAQARRLSACWTRLRRDPALTTAVFLEPPPVVSDLAYAVARRHAARVHGPDDRASHPIVLPVWWELDRDVPTLRAASPPEKPVPLAAVVSGKSWLPGHRARLAFLARLRHEGVPFVLFGRDLPEGLAGQGPTDSKAAVFGPARLVLAIENHAEGDRYVSEKLWDPLLAWALPLYHGPRAAERLVPPECFVRVPDLGDEGVRVVRDALARPDLWRERLEAIAEARRRILGDLRLVEWLRRSL
jgi:hypothetical protein